MPIAVMATGTRSNVTPVVLREDTRPPAYGDKYFEGASRTYIKYTEDKKQENVFARVYHESRTITPTQLEVAVDSHAGHGEGAEVEVSAAPAAVARVPPLLRRRWRRRRCCQQQRRARQHGSKSAGSSAKWECYRCGQRGHIARNCMAPFPVASGGEQGHSSAARQQRAPHKGINRGHRGAGRGGTSEASGSSQCTSAQQHHQKNNPGSSGSGLGGAAPQRTCEGGREFHHCFGAGEDPPPSEDPPFPAPR